MCVPRRGNSLFGQSGSQYDFSKFDIGQQKERARELEEQQRGMKRKVNPKVMNMIDTYVPALCQPLIDCANLNYLCRVEKHKASLKKMLGTVLKDKEKIKQTIEELDWYKRDALKMTWEKVNG